MPKFLSSQDLSRRIGIHAADSRGQLIFLLGSGVVLPNQEGFGIPGVSQILSIMQQQ